MANPLCGSFLLVATFLGLLLSPSIRAETDTIRLGKTLLETRQSETARKMVSELSRINTPLAHQALLLHVKRKGLADQEAFEALTDAPMDLKLPTLLARASQANGEDALSLRCIRALATVPGEEITRLLERLASDWSEAVKKAALEALELREEAGLPTSSTIKEVPYGSEIGELLQKKSALISGNNGTRKARPRNGKSSRSAAERTRGRESRYTRRVYPQGRPTLDAGGDPVTGARSANRPKFEPASPQTDLGEKATRDALDTAGAQEDAAQNQYQVRKR
jgi:hypothetical protein